MVSAIGFDPLDNGSTPLPSAKKHNTGEMLWIRKYVQRAEKSLALTISTNVEKQKAVKQDMLVSAKIAEKTGKTRDIIKLKTMYLPIGNLAFIAELTSLT